MSMRQSLAMTVAPLVIRLVLGMTFLWAGLGKLNAYDTVVGEDAALLANVGALGGPKPTASPDAPAGPQPDATSTKLLNSAEDFKTPVPARRLHTEVTLRLLKASRPVAPSGNASATPRTIWPAWLSGSRAAQLAWIVAVADLGAGICILLGLLTRLWALSLVGHLAVGVWLMVIGPAWASGEGVLGFLPRHDPWDLAYWMSPLWQLALLSMSVALACLGPGAVSLDRPLLGAPTPSGPGIQPRAGGRPI